MRIARENEASGRPQALPTYKLMLLIFVYLNFHATFLVLFSSNYLRNTDKAWLAIRKLKCSHSQKQARYTAQIYSMQAILLFFLEHIKDKLQCYTQSIIQQQN